MKIIFGSLAVAALLLLVLAAKFWWLLAAGIALAVLGGPFGGLLDRVQGIAPKELDR